MQRRHYKTPVTLLYRETEQINKADARIAGAQKHQGGVRRLVPPLGIIALQNFDYGDLIAPWHEKALNSPYAKGSYER